MRGDADVLDTILKIGTIALGVVIVVAIVAPKVVVWLIARYGQQYQGYVDHVVKKDHVLGERKYSTVCYIRFMVNNQEIVVKSSFMPVDQAVFSGEEVTVMYHHLCPKIAVVPEWDQWAR